MRGRGYKGGRGGERGEKQRREGAGEEEMEQKSVKEGRRND
jgi:hypothetical protein